jgi:hypothetical protein
MSDHAREEASLGPPAARVRSVDFLVAPTTLRPHPCQCVIRRIGPATGNL